MARRCSGFAGPPRPPRLRRPPPRWAARRTASPTTIAATTAAAGAAGHAPHRRHVSTYSGAGFAPLSACTRAQVGTNPSASPDFTRRTARRDAGGIAESGRDRCGLRRHSRREGHSKDVAHLVHWPEGAVGIDGDVNVDEVEVARGSEGDPEGAVVGGRERALANIGRAVVVVPRYRWRADDAAHRPPVGRRITGDSQREWLPRWASLDEDLEVHRGHRHVRGPGTLAGVGGEGGPEELEDTTEARQLACRGVERATLGDVDVVVVVSGQGAGVAQTAAAVHVMPGARVATPRGAEEDAVGRVVRVGEPLDQAAVVGRRERPLRLADVHREEVAAV